MPNLENLLKACIDEQKSGILTCNGISVSVIVGNKFVGVFDSHSRGLNGRSQCDGTACFVALSNVTELLQLLCANIPPCRAGNAYDGQYQFTVTSISVEDFDVTDNLEQVSVANNKQTELIKKNFSSRNINNAENDNSDVTSKCDNDEENKFHINVEKIIEKSSDDSLSHENSRHTEEFIEGLEEEKVQLGINTKEGKKEEIIIHRKILEDFKENHDSEMLTDYAESYDNEICRRKCVNNENSNYTKEEVNKRNADGDLPDKHFGHTEEFIKEIEKEELFCIKEPLNEGFQNIKESNENIIVNISWLWNQLHKAFDNHDRKFACNFANLKLIASTNIGLKKYLIFQCDMCTQSAKICTTPDAEDNLNLNIAAIMGCETIGIGLSQFEELFGACGIESMGYKVWQKCYDETFSIVKEAAEKEMSKAAAEEGRLAIERNDVVNGIPCTMVEGDGSYMKRSYMHSRYDSPACCVVIIGRYTKKVLQIIVKQKTCAICDNAFQRHIVPKKHDCYRNHGVNESSTSMESTAIAEAFSTSVEKHNLIYKVFISDGDSSNYKAILDSNPYGQYGVEVKNILCSNHIKRNVSNSLKILSKKRGNLGVLRKKIADSAPRFIEAITESINTISEESTSYDVKCRELRNNINKLPYHIFGDHSHCIQNKYGCTVESTEEANIVPHLQEENLFNDIEQCVYRAVRNIESLLQNVTTNKSESYNALIAKCIGGKRINFAKKNSYACRCYMAVLAYNVGETFTPFCEAAKKQVPRIGQNIQRKRNELNVARNIRNANTVEKKSKKVFRSTDEDYGLYAHQPDVNEEQYSKLVREHYQKLRDWQLEREKIEERTRNQSNNAEWRTKRKFLITASKMGKICKKRPETSCKAYVTDILYPRIIKDDAALNYGIAMEVVAIQILKDKEYDVQPCGLFLHKDVLGIAGTPDGLIGDDGIVEIKCPYTARDMDPEEAIRNAKVAIAKAFTFHDGEAFLKEKHDYYYQIQGQLSVTERSYCLFVIFTLKGIKIMRIEKNTEFIEHMIFEAAKFYRECLLPEIVDSRKKRRMPIRDPECITKSQNESKRRKMERNKKSNEINASDEGMCC